MSTPLNSRSRNMTAGIERTPNRSMLRAVGMEDADFDRPLVGIASAGSEVTPCNMHLDDLAELAKTGVRRAGGFPLRYNTFVVTDGEAMGHEGMKASLVSRDAIADTIELVTIGHQFDAIIGIGGCDKTIPGTVMPMARLNIPSVFVYGGSILPGVHRGRDVDIISAFEAVGAFSAGRIDEEERAGIERAAIPCQGACGGMYTANTMSSAVEALGMALPGNSSIPAVDPRKEQDLIAAGQAVIACLRRGLKPRDIMTREAFLNAIRVVMALGGSTNAVLHLLAMAHEAEVELTIDDFNPIAESTPTLADLKPAGRYVMKDLDQVGGVPMVLRMLLDAGLLYGDCITVTGRTMAENLADVEVRPRRAGRGLPGGPAAQGERRHPGDQGQPGARRGGAEVLRRDGAPPPRPGAGVRGRGGGAAGDSDGSGAQGRRAGDPLRGAARRSRDARDAGPDLGHRRRRPDRRRGADHRRPLLRRQPRHRGRPHRPGGAGRRPDRGNPRGRRHHY